MSDIQEKLERIRKRQKSKDIVFLSNEPIAKVKDVIPTGCYSLDKALGIGGLPMGRIVEAYGPESGGKTTLCLNIIAQAQKKGLDAGFIDVEHAFDPKWSTLNGVDVDSLLLSQPNSAEEALSVAEVMSEEGIDCVVIDSVAGLVPRAEIEGEMGDASIGLQARLMGQAMRKLTPIVSKNNTLMIFINQIRCLDINNTCLINGCLSYIRDVEKTDKLPNNVTVKNVTSPEFMSGVEIISKYRPSFKISNNHRMPIISEGKYILEKGEDIVEGDYFLQPILDREEDSKKEYLSLRGIVQSLLDSNIKNKVFLPEVLDEDLAFVLGFYYSDGSFKDYPNNSTYGVQWTEKNKERYSLVRDTLSKVFKNVSYSGITVVLNGKLYLDFFKKLGMLRYGKNKVIPELILKSKYSVIRSFIRGAFFDTHRFNQNGFIFTNENINSLSQFSDILYYIGIFGDIRNGDNKAHSKYLYFTGKDAVRFRDIIGFAEPTKQRKSLEFKVPENGRGKDDSIPYKYAKNIIKELKEEKKKNITDFKKYNNINVCLNAKLNIDRTTFIEFLSYMENVKFLPIIKNNRFTKIIKVKNNVEITAIDIEVNSKDSLFIASQALTHNSKIGVIYGSNETTSGGRALKFHASVRLDVRRKETLKDGKDAIGIRTKVKVVKNKVAPPFKEAFYDLMFDKGIDQRKEMLEIANDLEIINKSGTWYSGYGEKEQGYEKFVKAIGEENWNDLIEKS